jgi:hypothetical protein
MEHEQLYLEALEVDRATREALAAIGDEARDAGDDEKARQVKASIEAIDERVRRLETELKKSSED